MTLLRRRYFAIRHNPSGGFLPAVRGYGFTQTAPTLVEPPRLFAKMGPCTQALSRWLEGEQVAAPDSGDDENLIRVLITPRPDRRKIDMEIVEIEFLVRTLSEAELRRL